MLRSALAPLCRQLPSLTSRSLVPRGRQNAFFSPRQIPPRLLSTSTWSRAPPKEVSVTFDLGDEGKHTVKGKIGENLLDIVVDNEVDIDGFGACEGTLACSTCHLVFEQKDFDIIPDEVTDEELDMLDLAYGLTDTSRLGCQVCMTKDLDGITVKVPEGINDQR